MTTTVTSNENKSTCFDLIVINLAQFFKAYFCGNYSHLLVFDLFVNVELSKPILLILGRSGGFAGLGSSRTKAAISNKTIHKMNLAMCLFSNATFNMQ